MNDQLATSISGLIDAYLAAKQNDELGEEADYHERVEGYRTWLRDNILDYAKHNYSDQEFAQKFGEMFEHTYLKKGLRNLTIKRYFETDTDRIAIRDNFEALIDRINDPEQDRFALYQDLTDPKSPYQIKGIGQSLITLLINAKYPDLLPLHSTTEDFFAAIDEPLDTDPKKRQHELHQFVEDMIKLSGSKIDYDDANLIFWYVFNVESGQDYMRAHFSDTYREVFENRAKGTKTPHRCVKKILSPEERLAEIRAELQAVHDQANSK